MRTCCQSYNDAAVNLRFLVRLSHTARLSHQRARMRYKACLLPALTGLMLQASITAAQNRFESVVLPPESERRVVGTWRLAPPAPCTRSIEMVGSNYYMVARCVEDGKLRFGDVGTPLRRITDRLFVASNDVTYVVANDGKLIARNGGDLIFEAEPHAGFRP